MQNVKTNFLACFSPTCHLQGGGGGANTAAEDAEIVRRHMQLIERSAEARLELLRHSTDEASHVLML